MKIKTDRFCFSIVDETTGRELAIAHANEKAPYLSFREEVSEEQKQKIELFCEQQKDKVYILCCKNTGRGYEIGCRYLNGKYQTVAEENFSELKINPVFESQTLEIVKFVTENIKENFVVCQ